MVEGSGRAYIRRLCDSYFNNQVGVDAAKKNPEMAQIWFTNSDKTKGKLKDGTVVDTVPTGVPEDGDIGYRLNDGKYKVHRDPVDCLVSGGETLKPFTISELSADSGSGSRAMHVTDWASGKAAKLPPPTLLLSLTDNYPFNYGFGLFPSGKHIWVYVYDTVINPTLKTMTEVNLYWFIYENFKLTTVNEVDRVEWMNSTRTEYVFSGDATQSGVISLLDGLPQPDPASSPSGITSVTVGSVTYDFEPDPDYAYADVSTFYLQSPPDDLNLTAKVFPVRLSVSPREESDNDISIDFIGELTMTNNWTKVLRQTTATGSAATVAVTYGSLPASRFYLDRKRIADTSVNLTTDIGYAISAPDSVVRSVDDPLGPPDLSRLSIFNDFLAAYPDPTEEDPCHVSVSGTTNVVDLTDDPDKFGSPWTGTWSELDEFGSVIPHSGYNLLNYQYNDGDCNITPAAASRLESSGRISFGNTTDQRVAFVKNTSGKPMETEVLEPTISSPDDTLFCKNTLKKVAIRSLGSLEGDTRVIPYLGNEGTQLGFVTLAFSDKYFLNDIDYLDKYPNLDIYSILRGTDSYKLICAADEFVTAGEDVYVIFRKFTYNLNRDAFSGSIRRRYKAPTSTVFTSGGSSFAEVIDYQFGIR